MSARDERGAVATIVAVLLAMGVVLGGLAIAVDVGQVLVERRELQNSADAAALSLAASCWEDPASCQLGVDDMDGLADQNSKDGVTEVVDVCSMNIPGSPINGCPTAAWDLAECAPLPGAFAAMSNLPYVEVRTRAQRPDGAGGRATGIANWFQGRQEGEASTTAPGACARVAVGAPGGGGVGDIPITISACEWMRASGGTIGGGGGSYWDSPEYSGPTDKGYGGVGQPAWPPGAPPAPAYNSTPGGENVFLVQNPPGGQTQPSPCPNWQGHALPGGFGVLETVSGDPCKAKEYPYSWRRTQPGNNTSCDLDKYVGKVVSVPVYACTSDMQLNRDPISADPCDTGNGNNAWYWVAGYAKFYLSGYGITAAGSIPNKIQSINPNTTMPAPNTLPNSANPCANSESCISGWFLEASLSQSTSIAGPPTGTGYFGTYAVVPAG